MADVDLVNVANLVASELRAYMIPDKRLYRSGYMQRSIQVIAIDDHFTDIVIATDYASYTNNRGQWSGWVSQVVDRCLRAYAGDKVNDESIISGMIF